jgi:hypothetical protein
MCLMKFALIGFVFCWGLLGMAVAQGSLNEHANEITTGLWVTIIGLLGLVQALIGYIYISGQKSIKEQQRIMMNAINEMKHSSEKRDELLLSLHTEHRLMMRKCGNFGGSYKIEEED